MKRLDRQGWKPKHKQATIYAPPSICFYLQSPHCASYLKKGLLSSYRQASRNFEHLFPGWFPFFVSFRSNTIGFFHAESALDRRADITGYGTSSWMVLKSLGYLFTWVFVFALFCFSRIHDGWELRLSDPRMGWSWLFLFQSDGAPRFMPIELVS